MHFAFPAYTMCPSHPMCTSHHVPFTPCALHSMCTSVRKQLRELHKGDTNAMIHEGARQILRRGSLKGLGRQYAVIPEGAA